MTKIAKKINASKRLKVHEALDAYIDLLAQVKPTSTRDHHNAVAKAKDFFEDELDQLFD